MSGTLYIVPTPIGNLEDITLRAIKTLKEVDYIAAEDTRHTLKLLNHLEISKPLISYYRHNEDFKSNELIELLLNNNNIALISDAGTPVISDPGEQIVKECLKQNIPIISLPGPCALITALVASGLSAKEFTFIGFLPLNKKLRKAKLDEIKFANKTTLLYEAPHKLIATITDLAEILGDRKIVLAKELTKIHESFTVGTAQELLDNLSNVKGEFVIIIEGNNNCDDSNLLSSLSIEEHYKLYEKEGLTKNDIIKKIAKDRNVPKNDIYKYFIKEQKRTLITF